MSNCEGIDVFTPSLRNGGRDLHFALEEAMTAGPQGRLLAGSNGALLPYGTADVARLEDTHFFIQTRQTAGGAPAGTLFDLSADLTAATQFTAQQRVAPNSLFPAMGKGVVKGYNEYLAAVLVIMPYQSVRQAPAAGVVTIEGISYPEMTWDATPKGVLSVTATGRTIRGTTWAQQMVLRLFTDSAIDPVVIVFFPCVITAGGPSLVRGMYAQPAGSVSYLSAAQPLSFLFQYSSSITNGVAYAGETQLLDSPLAARVKLITPDLLLSQADDNVGPCGLCEGVPSYPLKMAQAGAGFRRLNEQGSSAPGSIGSAASIAVHDARPRNARARSEGSSYAERGSEPVPRGLRPV
jgi:hypothetical protein